jgi:hypothetical protein
MLTPKLKLTTHWTNQLKTHDGGTMNRLPGYDRGTRRSERVVFLSLGLAGLATISLAVAQMAKFVAGSDRIVAALSARSAVAVEGASNLGSKTAPTNFVEVEAACADATDLRTRVVPGGKAATARAKWVGFSAGRAPAAN